MARHRFGPEVVWTADTTFSPPHAQLAPGAAFTVWTDWSGGVDVSTSLTQIDGVTPFAAIVGADGEIPVFLGPDTLGGAEVYAVYIDAGSGERYPLYSDDRLRELVDGAAAGDAGTVAQQAFDLATGVAADVAALQASSVVAVGRPMRIWPRTAAEGVPTTAQGLTEGDYAAVDVS